MSDLRLEAALRAINWLRASNLQFAVKMPDGTIQGDLCVAEPPPVKKVTRVKVHHFDRDMKYIAEVKQMAPGGLLSWQIDAEKAYAFEDSLRGTARRYLGKDKFLTQVELPTDEQKAEGLKLAKVTILRAE